MLATVAAGLGATVFTSPLEACHRQRCGSRGMPSGCGLGAGSTRFAAPAILGYAGQYVPEVYNPFQNSLFGLRTSGNIHSEEGRNLIEASVIPDLRRRLISHKLNEWQVIPDTWYNSVTLCERRLFDRSGHPDPRVLFISAFVATNTGPGPDFPLIIFDAGGQRDYGDREAWYTLGWDHTVRIQAIQSGANAARLQIKWERH
jgi:hypothetical protein